MGGGGCLGGHADQQNPRNSLSLSGSSMKSGGNSGLISVICTWKDPGTPNFEMGIQGKKCGDLSGIYSSFSQGKSLLGMVKLSNGTT